MRERLTGIALALLLSVSLGVTVVRAADEPGQGFLIRDGDRVVFYGDSITDTEWYPTLAETYVLTHFPKWRNHFTNRGVSGDNSGSIPRFERDAVVAKADVILYNMGYNDGGYGTLTSPVLEKWLANIEKSVALARQANPAVRFALASPVPNEVAVSKDPREWYPYVLLSFGAEEAKLARRLNVPFVDTGLGYGQTMGLGQVAAGASFALSRDGVHPQREGQTFIAFHLLRGLGADGRIASVAIDVAAAKVEKTERCTVSDLAVKDGVVSFRRVCEALPYPTPPEARPFAFLVRLDDGLSVDLVTVKGLTAPAYTLFIDDQRVADLATAELTDGVNLSRYADTPMYRQALAVMDAVRQKQLTELGFWRQFIGAGKADGAGNPMDKATADERTAVLAAQKGVADAEAACYALNTPKSHVIRLEPRAEPVPRFAALAEAELNQAPLTIQVPPLKVDWNRQTLLATEVKATIQNPGVAPKTGALRWIGTGGWQLTPPAAEFTVDPGKTVELTFTATLAPGADPVPPPDYQVRWAWSKDWPYQMELRRPLELMPQLTIKRGAKLGLRGEPADWADATAFVMDQEYFVDPAVPGKRLLWGGPADHSAKLMLKWDDQAVYLAALVRDDAHLQNAIPMMMWSQDMLHVAFWMLEAGQPDGRYEFGFGSYVDRDAVVKYWDSKAAAGADLQFKSKRDPAAHTCFYEVAIPWTRLPPFAPKAGKQFRFTVAVSDADPKPGKGFNYLAWTPGINYGKNPADFATIVLGDK